MKKSKKKIAIGDALVAAEKYSGKSAKEIAAILGMRHSDYLYYRRSDRPLTAWQRAAFTQHPELRIPLD